MARDGKRTVRLFHALADETRLRILDQLADGEQCVCDLSGALEASQSRLSFHLKTLKDAGLLTDRREGRWIYYALDRETLEELRDLVVTIGIPQEASLKVTASESPPVAVSDSPFSAHASRTIDA
jgi:ArsR family transcriptional regulator, arsenate/arsenite/antimonite-responsive transcriptional repressor